jgi:hypothetical protein
MRYHGVVIQPPSEHVRLYAGVWGGKDGRGWIDDWTVEEIGPLNVLRRPGTPATVRSGVEDEP